jgi:hypothetical protein
VSRAGFISGWPGLIALALCQRDYGWAAEAAERAQIARLYLRVSIWACELTARYDLARGVFTAHVMLGARLMRSSRVTRAIPSISARATYAAS